MAETPPRKRQSDTTTLEDQISKLPDAILAAILSLLTIKEAGRTSVLSNRWPDLWKFTTHLNFDVPKEELMEVRTSGSEMKRTLRSKYVTWVNQVLRSHKCCSLDEFKVQFDLDASNSEDIDEWIKFMISKRTKKIEIDLIPYCGTGVYSLSQECNNFFKSEINLSNIVCLRSLNLGGVNVEGELVEYLLSKCPQLEMLFITCSEKLLSLKVSGPSLPLKYLKIARCNSLESMELSAPNLEAFAFYGKPVKFILGENPLLSWLHADGGCTVNGLASVLPQFSRCYSQIETLSLRALFEDQLELPFVYGFKNLKLIIWDIDAILDGSLIGVINLIMGAPGLEKLILQLRAFSPTNSRTLEEHSVQFHKCLKEVQIYEYLGCWSHFELARCLGKSAINLEKMVIDHSSPVVLFNYPERTERIAKLVAEQVEELKGSWSPRAELCKAIHQRLGQERLKQERSPLCINWLYYGLGLPTQMAQLIYPYSNIL